MAKSFRFPEWAYLLLGVAAIFLFVWIMFNKPSFKGISLPDVRSEQVIDPNMLEKFEEEGFDSGSEEGFEGEEEGFDNEEGFEGEEGFDNEEGFESEEGFDNEEGFESEEGFEGEEGFENPDEGFKSKHKTKITYKFVMYYSPSCGHCVRAKPEFMKLGKEQKIGDKVVTIMFVNPNSEPERVMGGAKITGYPTIRLYGPNDEPIEDYEQERTTSGFMEFLKTKVN